VSDDQALALLREWVRQGMDLLNSTLAAWIQAEISRNAMRNALLARGEALRCAVMVIDKLRSGQPCEKEYRDYQEALIALQHEQLGAKEAHQPRSNPASDAGSDPGAGQSST